MPRSEGCSQVGSNPHIVELATAACMSQPPTQPKCGAQDSNCVPPEEATVLELVGIGVACGKDFGDGFPTFFQHANPGKATRAG
jgi:hypothetical protein